MTITRFCAPGGVVLGNFGLFRQATICEKGNLCCLVSSLFVSSPEIIIWLSAQLGSFRLPIITALSNVLDDPPASLPDLFYFSVRTFFTSEATMARTVTIATMKKGRAP